MNSNFGKALKLKIVYMKIKVPFLFLLPLEDSIPKYWGNRGGNQ